MHACKSFGFCNLVQSFTLLSASPIIFLSACSCALTVLIILSASIFFIYLNHHSVLFTFIITLFSLMYFILASSLLSHPFLIHNPVLENWYPHITCTSSHSFIEGSYFTPVHQGRLNYAISWITLHLKLISVSHNPPHTTSSLFAFYHPLKYPRIHSFIFTKIRLEIIKFQTFSSFSLSSIIFPSPFSQVLPWCSCQYSIHFEITPFTLS